MGRFGKRKQWLYGFGISLVPVCVRRRTKETREDRDNDVDDEDIFYCIMCNCVYKYVPVLRMYT